MNYDFITFSQKLFLPLYLDFISKKMLMKRLLFVFIFMLSVVIYSNASNKDSLLKIHYNGEANAETYNQLAKTFYPSKIDSGEYFARLALKYALDENNKAQVGEAFYQVANSYYYEGIVDSTIHYYKKSLENYLETPLNNEIAGVYNDIGQVYQMTRNYDSSMVYFHLALQYINKKTMPSGYFAIRTNLATNYYYLGKYAYSNEQFFKILNEGANTFPLGKIATIYSNIGLNYKKSSNFEKAIQYYAKAMKIDDSLGLELKLAVDYSNMANAYAAWNKMEEALEFFRLSLEIYKKYGRVCDISSILSNIASTYRHMSEYKKAVSYYHSALDSALTQNCNYFIATAYHGLGVTYFYTKDYRKSIKYDKLALKFFPVKGSVYAIANTHLNMVRNFIALNNYKLAIIHLQKAEDFSNEINSLKLKRDIAYQYANYYTSIGKNEKSINYYQEFIQLNDSMFSLKSHRLLTEFQVKYDNLQKKREIEKFKLENALKQTRINQKDKLIWILSTGILVLLFMAFLLTRLYYQKRKSYQILFEKNKQELEEFKKAASNRKKIIKKSISSDVESKILSKLYNLMDNENIYLDQNLTIYNLAEKLNTNTSYLSKVINEKFSLNFNAFINKYRIQKAQSIILDKNYENYTLDAISQECGFRSKSSFYNAFKKFTGLTPSFYMANKNSS